MGDLVDRDPEAEVTRSKAQTSLDVDHVGPDEVDASAPFGRENEVVLPEHLLRQVAEEHADLDAERAGRDAAHRPADADRTRELLGERPDQALEAFDVCPHPTAAIENDRIGGGGGGNETRELAHEFVGSVRKLPEVFPDLSAHAGRRVGASAGDR